LRRFTTKLVSRFSFSSFSRIPKMLPPFPRRASPWLEGEIPGNGRLFFFFTTNDSLFFFFFSFSCNTPLAGATMTFSFLITGPRFFFRKKLRIFFPFSHDSAVSAPRPFLEPHLSSLCPEAFLFRRATVSPDSRWRTNVRVLSQ